MANRTDTGVHLDADPQVPLTLLLVLRLDIDLLHLRVENVDVVELQARVGDGRAGRRRAVQIIHRLIALSAKHSATRRSPRLICRCCGKSDGKRVRDVCMYVCTSLPVVGLALLTFTSHHTHRSDQQRHALQAVVLPPAARAATTSLANQFSRHVRGVGGEQS